MIANDNNKNKNNNKSIEENNGKDKVEVITKAKYLLNLAYTNNNNHIKIDEEGEEEEISIIDNEIRTLLLSDEYDMDEDTFQITNNSNDYFSFIENEIDECDLSFLEKEAYKNDKCSEEARGKYSICTASKLSKNIGMILKSNYGFEEIPKEFWFKSTAPDLSLDEDDSNMYRPENETICEWCDRSVFSFVDNRKFHTHYSHLIIIHTSPFYICII